jgi:hypothetical protein
MEIKNRFERVKGCPAGSVLDKKNNSCVYRFLSPSCSSGQVLVPKIGDWKKTNGWKFQEQQDKCMSPVLLSCNNRKTDDIPTFSLPSKEACPTATPTCLQYCYANKAERAWQWPLVSRSRNLWATKQPEFIDWMVKALKDTDSDLIRLHDAGDFYSQDYLNEWFDIAGRFPKKKFMAFTSNCGLDFKKKPKNMILYCSIWPDTKKAFKKKKMIKAFVYDKEKLGMQEKPRGRLCPAQYDHSITCSKCRLCWTHPKDIVFKLH